MITLVDFYKGRDKQYAADLTPEIEVNAVETVRRGNKLLAIFYAANPKARPRGCDSGWRPPCVNACTPGAAKKSKHMLGLAMDIEDRDRLLCKWLVDGNGQLTPHGKAALETCDLYIEAPSSTPTWIHIQTVPPASKRRVYKP